MVPVSARVGPITVKVNNSCNCCGKPADEPVDQLVYVNSKGKATRFSFSKAKPDPVSSQKRSLENTITRIGIACAQNRVDKDQAIAYIKAATGLDLDSSIDLTQKQVEKINKAFVEFVSIRTMHISMPREISN